MKITTSQRKSLAHLASDPTVGVMCCANSNGGLYNIRSVDALHKKGLVDRRMVEGFSADRYIINAAGLAALES